MPRFAENISEEMYSTRSRKRSCMHYLEDGSDASIVWACVALNGVGRSVGSQARIGKGNRKRHSCRTVYVSRQHGRVIPTRFTPI